MAFAKALQATFKSSKIPDPGEAATIKEFSVEPGYRGGSTDVGDVSWAVPTVGLRTATYVPGTPGHSWQAVACTGSSIGRKGMLVAAKALAGMALDLLSDQQLIEAAKAEWVKQRGDNFKYEPLLGGRKPALDYRN